MKKILTYIAITLLAVSAIWSQEFLMHDETFTWTKNADVCGGFHYWYDYGNSPSMNWTNPYDFQNGLFYFRFEIIDQPSGEPFQLNFCIWTEFNGSENWRESCARLSDILAGPGSVATFYGPMAPAFNGGIDWTDLSKLWRFGNPLWVNGHNLGNGAYCTDHPEEWAKVDSYLPMTLRVTIVAVANGYTFSGWSNYLNGTCTPVQQATPTYAVDYANWKTDKVVPSTDEYSYSSDMSGAISGTGQKLTLTAGQTVYFRTKKASDCLLASNIQTLVVVENCTPVQQATPTYDIDYVFEKTNEVISSTDEYSYSSNMASAVSGTGQKLTLTPGTDVYFRTKASGNCLLASTIQHLVVPARPAKPSISVDFISEKTNENASSNIFYSTSSSYTNPITGTGDKITLTPGQDLYLWVKPTASAFASMDYHLVVPNRPATPSVTFDYFNEVTSVIPVTQEWSTGASMTSATSGTNATILVTPGTDLYFRTKATVSAFESAKQSLVVPNRPLAPNYLIDYSTEKTSAAVPSTDEYSIHSDMSSPSAGAGAALILTPGTDLYFRTKSTAGSFRSAVQQLTVGARPATPSFSIDYEIETTSETVDNAIEYAAAADMISPSTGAGVKLALTPGEDRYFRVKATNASFTSGIFHLAVSERPVINSSTGDTLIIDTFNATVDFNTEAVGFDATDIAVTNAVVTLTGPLTMNIVPLSPGSVTIKVIANAILTGNFASETFHTYYKGPATSSAQTVSDEKASLAVFPSPVGDKLQIEITGNLTLPVNLRLIDGNGVLVVKKTISTYRSTIDMNEFPPGLYILNATDASGFTLTRKVIKQ
jgi:hypothetical protein